MPPKELKEVLETIEYMLLAEGNFELPNSIDPIDPFCWYSQMDTSSFFVKRASSTFKEEIKNTFKATLEMLLSERREASVDVNIQLAMQLLSSSITEISLEFSQVELAFLTILTRRLPAQLVDPPKLVEILRNIEKNLPYHLSL